MSKDKPLIVLILINSIFAFGANMFPPIFALFVEEIGGNVFSAGSLWAVFSVVTGILTLIITRYGDKMKETEYLIMAGYLFRAVAWMGYFFSHSLWQLYILQLLLAMGESLGAPAFNAIYSQHLDKGRYVREWGISNSFNSIIIGVAALLGGIIVFQFGFRTLFIIMSSLSIISLIFLLTRPRKLL